MYVEHVKRFVADIIERDFTGSDGKPWSERRIAESMGMAQPVLNSVRHGKGIGVNALLALREYSGQSIDAILGLALPERETNNVVELDEIQKQIDALIAVVQEQAGKRQGPYSKAAKALHELVTKRQVVQSQRIRDEKARDAARPVPKKRIA